MCSSTSSGSTGYSQIPCESKQLSTMLTEVFGANAMPVVQIFEFFSGGLEELENDERPG